MSKLVPLNRAQAHNAVRQVESELGSAAKGATALLLAQLGDDGVASVKAVHEALFPLADTTSAAAQLSNLAKKLEEAAKAKRYNLKLSFSGAKKDGVANRRVFFAAPRMAPVADTEGLDAIAPERRIAGQLSTPLDTSPRILLLTYNDNEFAAVRATFWPSANAPETLGSGPEAVDDLGTLNGWQILHAHSRQGNREAQRSASTLSLAYNPHAIISVGIAFGIEEKKQSIGDVLVSKFIVDYEAGRVGPGSIELRGSRPPATRRLVQGLEQLNVRSTSNVGWPKLHFGGLLTGEKLVDNQDYRDSLSKLASQGDLVGGDMEGAGIFTALDDTNIGWVVVKAICDFADGNKHVDKEKRQQLAASNAAEVVRALLVSPYLSHPTLADSDHQSRRGASSPKARPSLKCHALECCSDELNVAGQWADPVSLENIREGDERNNNAPKVVAFEHLLKWLGDDSAPTLYALLGEYGMGKTTHCQTLTRHLEEQRATGQAVRTPLYFDLRKVERIAAALPNTLGHVATLEETIQDCLRNGYLQTSGRAHSYQDVLDVIDEGAVVIFDGLDEVLSRIGDAQGLRFTANLLKVLPEAEQRQKMSGIAPTDLCLPKVLLSCRTQFFRNLAEQNSHLTGEHRGSQSASQYQASVLQAFTDEQIRTYLQAALPNQDIDELMSMVAAIHNLRELAGRPFTLKLIAQFVPRIQSWQAQGRTITGATLYREVAREWLIRDKEKQSFQPQDKERLAGDFAAHLWRTGQSGLRAMALEEWLDAWLAQLPAHAAVLQKPRELLHQDFRNATFLKRIDAEQPENSRFEFAHTSLQEFFLADYLFRALQQAAGVPANATDLRSAWAMPVPSMETLDFLGQILLEAGSQSAELQTLSGWRKTYLPLASELQLAYSIRAYQRDWPLPLTAGSDLHAADLSDWHFGSTQEPGVQATSATLPPMFDLSGSNFSNAKLRRTRFWRVRLDGADFSGAALTQAELLHCSRTSTRWQGVEHAGLVLRPTLPADADGEPSLKNGQPLPAIASNDDMALALHLASGHGGWVLSCAFSPDGRRVLSGSIDHLLKLWDTDSGECLRSFVGHGGGVTSCAFSPDGRRLLSGSEDKTLKLWDTDSGECLRSFAGHGGRVWSCAFSPDGRRLVSGSEDKTLKLWDTDSGECLRSFAGHGGGVWSCAFSPDGQRLLSGSEDKSLKLWGADSGECLCSFAGHGDWVRSCVFSPDGRRLLSGSDDDTLKLWDADSGECLRSFVGHGRWVLSCAFSPDGRRLLSGAADDTLKLWDADSGECLCNFVGHGSEVSSCAFSPDGRRLLSGSADRTLKLWGADSGECLRTFAGHVGRVRFCIFSPDGRWLLSASEDKTFKLWGSDSGECLRSFAGHGGEVMSSAFSPDGRRLLSASADHTLKLWDTDSGECLHSFAGHGGGVWSCAFSPDGRRLLSGSEDKSLRLWDADSGECLHSFVGHGSEVSSCSFSPDGRRLLSASADRTLKLWDTDSGECLRSFAGHGGRVRSCAFSPDGRRLLSGSADDTLKLWDADSGEYLRTFTGHAGWVMSCTFSPDGRRLLSASADDTLKLWDADSGECLRTFTGHAGWVLSCAFSPDGRRLLSGSEDKTLKLWDADSGECLRTTLDIPQGAATWEQASSKLLYASGRAWRYLRWQGHDANDQTCVWPLESLPGVVVEPWTLD